MSPEEANNLMQVMNNRINQLNQQNMILESRVMTLNAAIEKMKQTNDDLDYDATSSVE